MKKMMILMILGVLAGICLVGCGEKKKDAKGAVYEEPYVMEETAETATVELTGEEEELRRKEIEENYAMYLPFGLSYDSERDVFFYEGKTVRYFKDAISISQTNGFFYENGTVDLTAKRDEAGNLEKLVKASKEEFDERTKKQEEMEKDFGTAVGEATYACEEGDPTQKDSTLDAYLAYGIKHDDEKKYWTYQGKPIKLLYDEDYTFFQDGSVADGINVRVIRDDMDNIERISEMTDAEVEKIKW